MDTQLSFHNTQLSVINRNNQIWFTSAELAKGLDYADSRSISKIYNQYSDEFTPSMTNVTESVTSGNLKRSTRIFSLRGAHLIAMFARTKIAKEFRKWVLDILDKETANNQSVVKEPLKVQETTRVNLQGIQGLVNDVLWIEDILKTFRVIEAVSMLGGYELAGRLRGRLNSIHIAINLLNPDKSLASECNPLRL